MKVRFFSSQGPVDYAAGERTISAWKTELFTIDERDYITVIEGSDGHENNLGKSFAVIAFHFGGGKICFNEKHPIHLEELAKSLTIN